MLDEIDHINRLSEVDSYIRRLKNRRIQILSDQWMRLYLDRCGDNYISFEEFIGEVAFFNSYGSNTASSIEEAFGSINDACIYTVLNLMKSKDFHHFSVKVPRMICSACVCKGCPSMQEHLGYTCKQCKNDGYIGYQGYCDE